MTEIAANVQAVLENIRDTATQAGHDPNAVRLVAATKYVKADHVLQAIHAGVTICGENRLQEAQEKMRDLGAQPGVTWHFIGRLQRRKLKSIVGRFALIHSVESLEQIEEIDRRGEDLNMQQPILLQVNVGNEATKGGFSPSDLLEVLPNVSKFRHVTVRGVMGIPPREEDPEAVRPHFQNLKQLAEEIKALKISGVHMAELSMGMTNDYPIAIQEGATLVRVGTALFGERPDQ